jgi:Fe2+ transport system protein FeoA
MVSLFSTSVSDTGTLLSSLPAGSHGTVLRVLSDDAGRANRLAALGVTPGAAITVLQTFPGMVFRCDHTEVAVEPSVARAIMIALG